MADVTIVAADVRPLEGCIIRRFTSGDTIGMGQPVYLSAADTVSLADGSAVTTSFAIGVAVATPDGGSSADSEHPAPLEWLVHLSILPIGVVRVAVATTRRG